jgi:hypothetical protein
LIGRLTGRIDILVFPFVGGASATAASLGQVRKASIHCKHSCERRSAAEDDVGNTKAHVPISATAKEKR